ncbi:MAG TPA: hemerythrin domain-containing protein [Gammaproteobacteria bacterium]
MEYRPGRVTTYDYEPFAETETAMLLSFLSRKNKKQEPLQGAQAPQPEIAYDPGLITALTLQHRSLTSLLVKATSLGQQRDFAGVQTTLEQFKAELDEHLHREHDEFFPYLTAHLKTEDAKDILKEARSNSLYIERAVESFLSHYAGYPVGERTVLRFGMELSGVIEEFCERLEKEEADIYTLYMPPEAY